MEQVDTVETSKGADAGLTVGCQVVSTVDRLLLGSEGSQCCLPHHRLPQQGGGLCSQLQQALEADTHNSKAVVLSFVTHVKFPSFCMCTVYAN